MHDKNDGEEVLHLSMHDKNDGEEVLHLSMHDKNDGEEVLRGVYVIRAKYIFVNHHGLYNISIY